MSAKKWFTDQEREEAKRNYHRAYRQRVKRYYVQVSPKTKAILDEYKAANKTSTWDKTIQRLLIQAGVIKPKITIPQVKGRNHESY